MADKNNTTSSGGLGFGGLLTLIFITLKLLGKIDWSWWWVLSPLWIGLGLLLAFLAALAVGMFIHYLITK